ncbi:MAG: (E)-4-hydroxy-3-methylbut-2-enyl-diphosphate synthase [Bacteroides sp.]|nr:(E)-4-hydroxy-3-methylbut-2-enyl-diphosphate synthase [Ruminococcus flavefaciens]MCM1554929.1 (E)-4-hydroxy-3-methylbut-2-enyl-diphosphate synthase [Bacteroides sp.]
MHFSLLSKTVRVGKLLMGGENPVVIQSMTNTDSLDTEATVAQSQRMFDLGCQLVRITAPGLKEARNLENIKNRLVQKGYDSPLCADIHFLPEAALVAAQIVEKVRINPGNYCDRKTGKTDFTQAEQQAERQRIGERIAPLLEVCKKHGTAIRIGVNQGSLSERMVGLYGNTPLAMVESAVEFTEICHTLGFDQIVVSMKSSRVKVMDEAVRMFAARMKQNGLIYPLHLGVTEAGDGQDARLLSAIGIGSLLADGIGNTIRVSLTEAPENEIPVAQRIVKAAEELQQLSQAELAEKHLELTGDPLPEEEKIQAAIRLGRLMLQGEKEGFAIDAPDAAAGKALLNDILQAAGIRFHKTRFIACPSCGRTKYDIQKALAQVKEMFPNHPNLTIAVMGCVVNGPGEMAGADFGYIGCGGGKVNLYRQGVAVKLNVPETQALTELKHLIEESSID